MTTPLEKQAEALANQPYSVESIRDETTDGHPIFLVSHPELRGCMAQGTTLEEALASLADARREYILSLLEDGLPVPGPFVITSGTGGPKWNPSEGLKRDTGPTVYVYDGATSHASERTRDSGLEQSERPTRVTLVEKL